MSADSQNDAADNGQVAEEPPQLPASSAEVSQLRNEQLGNIRETAERLRDAINELSRLEHGIPGLSSAFLQGGVIEPISRMMPRSKRNSRNSIH